MIQIFDLSKPEMVSDERLLGLMRWARQIVLEFEGIYDFALYQTEYPNLWKCSVDADDEQVWKRVQSDPRLLRLWNEIAALGISIIQKSEMERRV